MSAASETSTPAVATTCRTDAGVVPITTATPPGAAGARTGGNAHTVRARAAMRTQAGMRIRAARSTARSIRAECHVRACRLALSAGAFSVGPLARWGPSRSTTEVSPVAGTSRLARTTQGARAAHRSAPPARAATPDKFAAGQAGNVRLLPQEA